MKKILWLCNGAPSRAIMLYQNSNKGGISWIDSLLDYYYRMNNVEFYIFFPENNIEDDDIKKDGNIQYHPFKIGKSPHKYYVPLEKKFFESLNKIQPDIIHIFGTEFPHCLSMMRAVQSLGLNKKAIINIQGLCSVIEKHYYAFLPFKVIYKFTFRDFLKQDNISQQRKKFGMRGEYEREAIKLAYNVVGRTEWDKACIKEINPDCKYYCCNEMMREVFYKNKWDIQNCEKHSIFITQSYYPLKGFHILLQAILKLRTRYPDIKVYTVGNNPITNNRIKEDSYSEYIRRMIIQNKMQNQVIFLKELSGHEICQQYMNAHVFVLPSSIENSSNSLAEAMLLGVPSVVSDVGGARSLFRDRVDGFMYPADEDYMLAYYIGEIFENDSLALSFSDNSREHASFLYNEDRILHTMEKIYEEVGHES